MLCGRPGEKINSKKIVYQEEGGEGFGVALIQMKGKSSRGGHRAGNMPCVPARQLERACWCRRQNGQTAPAQTPAGAVHILAPVFQPNQPWVASYPRAHEGIDALLHKVEYMREKARPATLSLWRRCPRREPAEDEPPPILVSWSSRLASSCQSWLRKAWKRRAALDLRCLPTPPNPSLSIRCGRHL